MSWPHAAGVDEIECPCTLALGLAAHFGLFFYPGKVRKTPSPRSSRDAAVELEPTGSGRSCKPPAGTGKSTIFSTARAVAYDVPQIAAGFVKRDHGHGDNLLRGLHVVLLQHLHHLIPHLRHWSIEQARRSRLSAPRCAAVPAPAAQGP